LWILADWRQKFRLFETKNLDCFTKNISCLFGIVLNLALQSHIKNILKSDFCKICAYLSGIYQYFYLNLASVMAKAN